MVGSGLGLGWLRVIDGSPRPNRLMMVALAQRRLNARSAICPRTHIARLFLAPNNFGIGEIVCVTVHEVKGKRTDLFNACNGDIGNFCGVTRFDEIVVDFSLAENNATDGGVWFAWGFGLGCVGLGVRVRVRWLGG